MAKGLITFLFFLSLFQNLFSQINSERIIAFNVVWNNNESLELNTKYQLANKSEIQFENIKFYISSIRFYEESSLVFSEDNSFHLIDLNEKGANSIHFSIPEKLTFNRIIFNLGIDSTINVSGVFGGDLDPTKGMYWTWQSGYINAKLEGSCNLIKDANHQFELHVGGYEFPNNTCQEISLGVKTNDPQQINFNLYQFFNSIDLSKKNHVMSPGNDAVLLSEKLSKCFSISK